MTYKKFTIYLLVITLFFYLVRTEYINFSVKYYFEKSVIYDRGGWLKEDLIFPKVIFLGSSMTRHTVIPEIISNNSNLEVGDVVNLGMNAATPYEMFLTFKKNIEQFKKADLVIYNLDPWIYSKKYYQHKKYEKVLWSKAEWDEYSFDPDLKSYLNYKKTLFEESKKAKSYSRPKFIDYGYEPLECIEEFKLADEEEVKNYFFEVISDDDLAISEFQIKYLKKIKDLAGEIGAEFVILYVPNHDSYRRNILLFNEEFNRVLSAKINEAIGHTKQIGGFCYISNGNLILEEDFYDRHHICKNGAVKFSGSLGNIFDLVLKADNKKINIDYSCYN